MFLVIQILFLSAQEARKFAIVATFQSPYSQCIRGHAFKFLPVLGKVSVLISSSKEKEN